MMKPLIGGAVLSLIALSPALAVAPPCEDQLAQLDQQLRQNSGAKAALTAKLNEAQRLCQRNKDEQAQEMARQIRQELAGQPPSSTAGSGSSMPSGTTPPKK
jgi:hypothetical protein